ncbi:MAG: ribonuclease P protein component [Nitrospirota bacterium]|nr:ribonuclease P protein component [Nitrospirota bacterium]
MPLRPRDLRLTRSGDIRKVFAGGKRVQDSHLRIIHLANHLGHPRFCVPVSRKVARSAVRRNRIRRRTREAARPVLMAGTKGVDLVILPNRTVAEMPWPELERRLRQLLERILT